MIKVVCGIIYHQEKIFLCRRKPEKSLGGYWEFPGGKIEAGEEPEDALRRELQEELSMEVSVEHYFATSQYDYPNFSIELIAYICQYQEGVIELTDHDELAWVNLPELLKWRLSPADVPLAERVVEMGNRSYL